MNQPREVWHNATATQADGSVGGSFSGTYDNFTGPTASSFAVDWSRNSSAESWVFGVSLRISQSYNDIVLYFAINNDGPGGYGGYDWEGRGMMLRPTSADSVLLRATLRVNEWKMSWLAAGPSPRRRFAHLCLPEMAGRLGWRARSQ